MGRQYVLGMYVDSVEVCMIVMAGGVVRLSLLCLKLTVSSLYSGNMSIPFAGLTGVFDETIELVDIE